MKEITQRDFDQSFFDFLKKLKKKENFAFVRFSDGELDVLQNLYVELSEDKVKRGTEVLNVAPYLKEDYKIFDPEVHQESRKRLLEALKFRKKNYFKGLSCPCCVPAARVSALLDIHGEGDEEHIVWANQFVNSNYPYFMTHMYGEIKKRKDVILIGNESIDFNTCEIDIKKFFGVGYSCFINDLNLVEDIKAYMIKDEIKNHIFLFSAGSLSEILIHELYKFDSNNTYLDIGTTLHKQLGMGIARDYLKAYWNGVPHPDLYKQCIHPLKAL